MQKLSAADRTLVSLYLENLDTAEIAQTTGLSEANVRVKIHRIKKQIQQEWEAHNGTR
jgi:RNA polymerase sigma-70 factor (ECF subfamily)